jgi:pilus assembly protein Flp/PilA
MNTAFFKFIRDERGATAIEYGIIAGLMAVILTAIFASNGVVANALTSMFTHIASLLPGATP